MRPNSKAMSLARHAMRAACGRIGMRVPNMDDLVVAAVDDEARRRTRADELIRIQTPGQRRLCCVAC